MPDPDVPPIPSVPSGLGSLAIYLQEGRAAGLALKRGRGGAVHLLVVPRGRTGFRESRAQEFPMTEDGWTKAWSAFQGQDAAAASQIAGQLEVAGRSRALRERMQQLTAEQSFLSLPRAQLIAGYRTEPLAVGSSYLAQFLPDTMRVVEPSNAQTLVQIPYADVLALRVDGDEHSGSRLSGGQFALAVAAEGLLTAALMNSVAARHPVAAYVELQTEAFHGVFLTTDRTPMQVRLALKPVEAQLRMLERDAPQQAPPGGDDLLSRLERLQALKQQGALTPDEFDVAKRRILG